MTMKNRIEGRKEVIEIKKTLHPLRSAHASIHYNDNYNYYYSDTTKFQLFYF